MDATQNHTERLTIYGLTVSTFGLAFFCFYYAFKLSSVPFFLLACVTFGTAFDFLSHILGIFCSAYKKFLLGYAKINFSLLCFGIVFTPLAASFVIAELAPAGLNSRLVSYYPSLLLFSLLFGAFFLFTRYTSYEDQGALEFTLDKQDGFTRRIFVARRILLALSLVIAVIAVIEGFKTGMALWTLHFAALYTATIPLHILRKKLSSMAVEAITLVLLVYGYVKVFVE